MSTFFSLYESQRYSVDYILANSCFNIFACLLLANFLGPVLGCKNKKKETNKLQTVDII